MIGDVDRHLPPAIEIEAEAQDLGFHDGAAGLLRHVVGARKKYLADRDAAGTQPMPGLRHRGAKEFLRHLQMDPGAVAGLAVGVHRTAMPDRFQRLDGARDHLAARLAVDRGNEADAAGIVLLLRRIGVRRFELRGVGEKAPDLALGVARRTHSAASRNADVLACR